MSRSSSSGLGASAHDAHRARIAPVSQGVPRPTWSVMIPTYNCAAYLRETLHRVLQQAPPASDMQIEVVDDHSTADDPECVVREFGRGRVSFFRQRANVGHVANFATALQRARGRLVHLLHGDDYVLHGFYERMRRPFETHPELGAAFCRHVFMNEAGHWLGVGSLLRESSGVLEKWLERIATGQLVQTPSVVVRRDVYERLGGFDDRLRWVEDWEMWVRIAAHYPVWYETEVLAAYRMHGGSSTARLSASGETVRDVRRAIEINKAVLPTERVAAITAAARRANALGATRSAARALAHGDSQSCSAQLAGALRLSKAPSVVLAVSRLALRSMLGIPGRIIRGRAPSVS